MCMNNNPVNCNCIHCHNARFSSGQHDTNINRPHQTPNIFGQRQQQSTFNPFGQQPHNPIGQPWNHPHTPVWPRPDTYISRPYEPYKPYDPLTPITEDKSLFENIINKPKSKNTNIKPIDDVKLLTMHIYDGFKSETDDNDLIKYFAFNVDYLMQAVDDVKYRHGYFHDGGAHLAIISTDKVVVSSPKLKMVVTRSTVDFEVSEEIGTEKANTLGKHVVSIIALVRDVIESSRLFKSVKSKEDVAKEQLSITLEDFYNYVSDLTESLTMTFCSIDFSVKAQDNYISYYIEHEDFEDVSFGYYKSEPMKSFVTSIVNHANVLGDKSVVINNEIVVNEINRLIKLAS